MCVQRAYTLLSHVLSPLSRRKMTWPAFSGSSSAAEGTDEDGFRGGVEGDGPQEIPKDQQIRRFVRRRGIDLFLQSTFYTGLVLILLTFGYAQAVAECMCKSMGIYEIS